MAQTLLITGACGFVGSRLIQTWRHRGDTRSIVGIDNFNRPGSEFNRDRLRQWGVKLVAGDLRCRSDVESLPPADVVIDAAALPSVLGGVDGKSSPRQVVEHNLVGTINLLEYCRLHKAAFVLLSTSRVYSLDVLASLPMQVEGDAFAPDAAVTLPSGVSPRGVTERFATRPPVSLYGATKLASETLALEYGQLFDFPVCINRCGVLAGPGQFGQPEQGIVSYWIHSWRHGRPLRYLGFEGSGRQTRDALDPADLITLLDAQIAGAPASAPRIVNVSGGSGHAFSLRTLSAWCARRFGPRDVTAVPQGRPLDVPWLVLDHALAAQTWGWRPQTSLDDLFESIAAFADAHPDWLDRSASG